MASQLLGIKTRFTNDLGSPLVGGQVYTYFAGTSTNQDSYSDAALTVPNTNPVILDDTGSADIFLKGSYRIRVFDKSGRFIEEQDNVTQAASQGDATNLTNKVNAVEIDLVTANAELKKVKFDTGVTATAQLIGQLMRSQAEKNIQSLHFKDFGGIGDGSFHPLSEKYSTLALAQAQYPNASSLSDGIDSLAIQAAIDAAALEGVTSIVSIDGYPIQDKTIVLKSKVHLLGSGVNSCVITKKAGFDGRALITEGFDALTGTVSNDMPYGFSIKGIMFHGQWMENEWSSATNSYVNTSGGGVFIYGRDYELDVDIRYQAGIGLWQEGKTDGTSFDKRYDLKLNLRIFVCKEECHIFKGGNDIVMQQVFCAFGGAAHKQDTASLPRSSPTYGATNGGRTDNMVFDEGCEIGTIHSWASQSGYAIKLKNGRINADFLMGESARMGGIDIDTGIYGMINRIDAHSCYGNMDGSTPDIHIKSNNGSGLHIGKIRDDRNGSENTHGQTALQIDGSFVNIGYFLHNGRGQGGHGLKVAGSFNTITDGLVHNVVGNAADGNPSAGLWRKGTGNNTIKLKVINLPVVFWSDGAPTAEQLQIDFMNSVAATEVIKGSARNYSQAQDWRISGYNATKYLTTMSNVSGTFNSAITTEQQIVINHNLVHYSNINNFQASIAGELASAVEYCYIRSVSGTTVTVRVKMATATATNLNPQINVFARA